MNHSGRARLIKDMCSIAQANLDNFIIDGADLNQAWYTLVSTYSGYQVTDAGDRLPALSGLAHQFADQDRDIYLGGLWR